MVQSGIGTQFTRGKRLKSLYLISVLVSAFAWGESMETRLGIAGRMGVLQTDSVDSDSLAKARLVSETDFGGKVFVDRRGKKRTFLELGFNRVLVSVPAGKSLTNNPPWLFLGRFGYGFHPGKAKRNWITFVAGYEQVVIYRATDFTTLRVDQVGLPTFGVRWTWDLMTGTNFGFEMELAAEGIPPFNGQYERIKWGVGGMGKMLIGFKLSKKLRLALGGETWYRWITTEYSEQKLLDVRGMMNLHFVL